MKPNDSLAQNFEGTIDSLGNPLMFDGEITTSSFAYDAEFDRLIIKFICTSGRLNLTLEFSADAGWPVYSYRCRTVFNEQIVRAIAEDAYAWLRDTGKLSSSPFLSIAKIS